MTRLLCLLGLLGCGGPPQIPSPRPQPGALSAAVEAHPAVEAARGRWRGAAADARAADRLPDPTLGYTYAPRPIETRLGAAGHAVNLTQRAPWPGTIAAEVEARAAAAGVEAAGVEALSRDLRRRAARLYWARLRLSQRAEALGAQLITLDALFKVAEGRAHLGGAPLNRVALRRIQLQTQREGLEDKRRAVEARLRALLGEGWGDLTLPSPPRTPPAFEALRPRLQVHPELRAARRRVEATQARVERARLAGLPGFQVGARWTLIEAGMPGPDSGRDALALTAGLSLPVWREATRAGVEAAEARGRAAEAAVAAVERRLSAALAEAHAQILEAARRLERLERTERPQAEAWLQAQRGAYEAGGQPLDALLQATLDLWRVELALIDTHAAHAQAWADLEALTPQTKTPKERP